MILIVKRTNKSELEEKKTFYWSPKKSLHSNIFNDDVVYEAGGIENDTNFSQQIPHDTL